MNKKSSALARRKLSFIWIFLLIIGVWIFRGLVPDALENRTILNMGTPQAVTVNYKVELHRRVRSYYIYVETPENEGEYVTGFTDGWTLKTNEWVTGTKIEVLRGTYRKCSVGSPITVYELNGKYAADGYHVIQALHSFVLWLVLLILVLLATIRIYREQHY